MNTTKPTPDQIQNLVMEVMNHSRYLQSKGRYWTDYFSFRDRENFQTCIVSEGNEMETFLRDVRRDSKKYLTLHPELISQFNERPNNNTEENN